MSPLEQAGVNDALREFRSNLELLQLDRAEFISSDLTSADHREVSFRLSALPDEIRSLRQAVVDRVHDILGSQRAALLAEPITSQLSRDVNPLGESDVIVSFSGSRDSNGEVTHRLRFSDAARSGNWYEFVVPFEVGPNQGFTSDEGVLVAGLEFPLKPDSALWGYRHLFGDQPLIPPRVNDP
jgi:hypothetical protein